MKIKHIYILLSFVVSVLSLTSCNSALDLAPQGMVSLNEVFSDNDKVAAYLNTCYANVPVKGTHYWYASRGPVEWCDEAWDADDISTQYAASAMLYDGNTHVGFDAIDDQYNDIEWNYWRRYWGSIHDCSVFLSRIKTATVTKESDRNRWTAEAHVLRAYYYSELLKWYGCALPLEKEPYDLAEDFGKTKRASYYNVVKFIQQDCDSALNISTSDFPWHIVTDNERGRVTKALAEAIKSKMILFAASPLYTDGDHWEEAYQINKASLADLKANGYQLYNAVHYPQVYLSPDAHLPNQAAAIYNEYFCTNMTYTSNPIDQETIFQSTTGPNTIWVMDGVGAENQYKTGTCPSQELVDSYETTDGQPIVDLTNPYSDEQHTLPNYINSSLYHPDRPYENRDPRFYASIYYNGSQRKCQWNFAETPECIGNYPAPAGNRTRTIYTWDGEPQTGINRLSRTGTRTGYYERKFLHPFAGNDYQDGGAYTKLFRLGEVILDYAEAAVMAGHDQEAIDAVNEIRTRAGMPNLPSGIGHEDLILRVKHERRVELAMEENRYFDVRRWSAPTGDLSKTDKWITAMDITRNSDGSFTYTRRPVRALERKCYASQYLRLPINQTEANLMQSITGENWQNPGW